MQGRPFSKGTPLAPLQPWQNSIHLQWALLSPTDMNLSQSHHLQRRWEKSVRFGRMCARLPSCCPARISLCHTKWACIGEGGFLKQMLLGVVSLQITERPISKMCLAWTRHFFSLGLFVWDRWPQLPLCRTSWTNCKPTISTSLLTSRANFGDRRPRASHSSSEVSGSDCLGLAPKNAHE